MGSPGLAGEGSASGAAGLGILAGLGVLAGLAAGQGSRQRARDGERQAVGEPEHVPKDERSAGPRATGFRGVRPTEPRGWGETRLTPRATRTPALHPW